MPAYETSALVHAPVEVAWPVLSRVPTWPQWLPTVDSVRPLDGDAFGIGVPICGAPAQTAPCHLAGNATGAPAPLCVERKAPRHCDACRAPPGRRRKRVGLLHAGAAFCFCRLAWRHGGKVVALGHRGVLCAGSGSIQGDHGSTHAVPELSKSNNVQCTPWRLGTVQLFQGMLQTPQPFLNPLESPQGKPPMPDTQENPASQTEERFEALGQASAQAADKSGASGKQAF